MKKNELNPVSSALRTAGSQQRRVIPRTWSMDAPTVRDKVILATSRAYGYRGTNADTASKVLERHGYKLIPW